MLYPLHPQKKPYAVYERESSITKKVVYEYEPLQQPLLTSKPEDTTSQPDSGPPSLLATTSASPIRFSHYGIKHRNSIAAATL